MRTRSPSTPTAASGARTARRTSRIPVRVARLLAGLGYDEHVLAAALLHDVVEDTPVTLPEIRQAFGERIALLVD